MSSTIDSWSFPLLFLFIRSLLHNLTREGVRIFFVVNIWVTKQENEEPEEIIFLEQKPQNKNCGCKTLFDFLVKT